MDRIDDVEGIRQRLQEQFLDPIQRNHEKTEQVVKLVKQLQRENAQLKKALAEKEEPRAAEKTLHLDDLRVQLSHQPGKKPEQWARIRDVLKTHEELCGVTAALEEARAMSLRFAELGQPQPELDDHISKLQHAYPRLFEAFVDKMERLDNRIMIPLARTEEGEIFVDGSLLAAATAFAKQTKGVYPVAMTYGDRVFRVV